MVLRWFFLFLALGGLWGCQPHDEAYFRTHPEALFATFRDCQSQASPPPVCHKLSPLVQQFQRYAEALRQSPQGFGQQVMTLEARCAAPLLTQQEKQTCAEDLALRYAVIKWFESPGALR